MKGLKVYRSIVLLFLIQLFASTNSAAITAIYSMGGKSLFGRNGESGSITIGGKTYTGKLIKECLKKNGVAGGTDYYIIPKDMAIVVKNKKIKLESCENKVDSGSHVEN